MRATLDLASSRASHLVRNERLQVTNDLVTLGRDELGDVPDEPVTPTAKHIAENNELQASLEVDFLLHRCDVPLEQVDLPPDASDGTLEPLDEAAQEQFDLREDRVGDALLNLVEGAPILATAGPPVTAHIRHKVHVNGGITPEED